MVRGTSGGEHDKLDVKSMEEQVVDFLGSIGIQLDCNNIEACHPLPRKSVTDKPAIILRFINRTHKKALLKEGRKLKE